MIEIRKVYSRKFREQVVRDYVYGSASYTTLVQRYGLSSGLLGKWVRRYRAYVEEEEGSPANLQRRVMELERMVGRLTMENDLLKKFAAYAKQQTNERSSIVTAKTLAAKRSAGWLALPAAATTIDPEESMLKNRRMRGSKNG